MEPSFMKSVRRYRWITSGVLAAVLITVISGVQAAPKKDARKKKAANKKKAVDKKKAADKKKAKGGGRKGRAVRFYSDHEISMEFKLSPQQQVKFNEARQKLDDALAKWDASPRGQKLQELQTALEMAVTPEEKRKASGSLGEIRMLKSERSMIAKQFEGSILAALPPRAKAIRFGYRLYNRIMAGRLGQTVSSQQAGKIKSYCMQAGAQIVKGSISSGSAERRLQQLAVGTLGDDQKKKLGLAVAKKEPERNKNRKKNNNRRRNNRRNNKKKKLTPKQLEAAKKKQAALNARKKAALEAQKKAK